MTQQQQQQNGMFVSARQGFDIIYSVALGHAMCIWVFIHSRIGIELLGWPAIFGLGVQLIYSLIAPAEAMGIFFPIWLLFVINRRFCARMRENRGYQGHSRYTGYPWLAMRLPFVTWERTAKVFVEPMMCLLGGAMLCSISEPLGVFVMCGFVSMLIVQGIESEILTRRTRRMRDAHIDMQEVSGRFRR